MRHVPKIYFWIILALVVLNLGTLAALWLLPAPEEQTMRPADWLKNELQLTEAQEATFVELRQAHFARNKEVFREMRSLRRQMIETLDKGGEAGLSEAEAFIPMLAERQAELDRLLLTHYLELQQVCTDAQREKLKEIFLRMNRSKGHGPNHGKNSRKE